MSRLENLQGDTNTLTCKKIINHLIYMNEIKLFQKEKNIGDSNKNNKNIQSEYTNGMWHKRYAIPIMRSEKKEKKRIAWARKNQNNWRKGNVQVLIWNKTQKIGDERKKQQLKRRVSDERENFLRSNCIAGMRKRTSKHWRQHRCINTRGRIVHEKTKQNKTKRKD